MRTMLLFVSALSFAFTWFEGTNSKKKRLSVSSYQAFLRSHAGEMQVYHHHDMVKWSVRFVPKEMRILQLIDRGEIELAEELQNSTTDELELLLTVEHLASGKQEFLHVPSEVMNYDERVAYYHFEFVKQLKFVGSDLNAIQMPFKANFERTFNTSNKGVFVLFLPDFQKLQDGELQFEDRVYGGGQIRIPLPLSKWKNYPSLQKVDQLLKRN
jgi:hypothetical protein